MFAACITMGEFSYLTQNGDKYNEKAIEGLKVVAQYFERQRKKKLMCSTQYYIPGENYFNLMVIS